MAANSGPLSVQIEIQASVEDLQRKLRAVTSELKSIGGAGGSAFSSAEASAESFQQKLRSTIGRFSALWAAFKATQGLGAVLFEGVKFNALMEDARLGIAALITAQGTLTSASGKQLEGQEALNAAWAISDEQVQKLRISGLQTAATTEQLTAAFQDAVGPGLAAKLTFDQIRQLTVLTVQAAGAMGVPMSQLNQEIRSMLSGTIDRNSRVAKVLNIDNADIQKWKAAGVLFEKLHERMASFSAAGERSMGNWTTIVSNIKEATQILLGAMTLEPFREMKNVLNDILTTIVDVKTANLNAAMQDVVTMGKDLVTALGGAAAALLRGFIQLLKDMGAWWVQNRVAANNFLSDLGSFITSVLGPFFGILKGLISAMASFALWFSALPEPVKAANIALLVFVVGIQKLLSIGPNVVTGLGMMGGAFTKLQTVVAYTSEFGLKGFGYAIASMMNPVGIVIALVAALAVGMMYMSGAAGRATDALLRVAGAARENSEKFGTLAKDIMEYEDKIKKAKPGSEELRNLLAQQGVAMKQMLAVSPSFLRYLAEEAEHEDGLARAIARANRERRRTLELQARILETELASTQSDIKERETKGGGDRTGLGVLTDTVFKYGATLNSQKESAQKLAGELNNVRTTLRGIMADEQAMKDGTFGKIGSNFTPRAPKEDEGKAAKALEHQKSLNEANLFIEEMRAKAMERLTIREQEAYKLKQLEIQETRMLGAIETDKSLTVDERNRKSVELKQAYEMAKVKIVDDANRRIEEIEASTSAKVEILEADTLDRRILKLRKAFDDANAQRAREGLSQFDAAQLEARIAVETTRFVNGEVEKLKKGLKDLEEEKGRALNFTEQKAALVELAEKLGISQMAVRQLTDELETQRLRTTSWKEGMLAGVREFVTQVTDKFQMLKTAATLVLSGVTSAFAKGIEGMLTGQMNLSQGMKAIWKGIVSAVASAIAQLMAQWIVGIIAAKLFKTSLASSAMAAAAAQQMAAAASIWAAYGGIPFVGPALAVATIALMNGSLAANAAIAKGISATGRAVGGVVSGPELTMLGERGPEIVAPLNDFQDFVKSFSRPNVQQLAVASGERGASPPSMSFPNAMFLGSENETRKMLKNLFKELSDEFSKEKE